MEFKRCLRCGSFFVSNSDTCGICETKDKADLKTIKNFFQENEGVTNINELSMGTNITEKNIVRLMGNQSIENINGFMKNEQGNY